jgi:hypothetical protein
VMVNKEVDQLIRYLQNRYIAVEVDLVQAPYVDDHVITKDNSSVRG